MFARLAEIEEVWLGWSFPPAERALAGWRPDRPGAYCARCGATTGPGETTAAGCGACRRRRVGPDGVVRLGAYGGPLRDWLRAVKYQRWGEMGAALGRRLGAAVMGRPRVAAAVAAGRAVVVPMPMPWQRRCFRGIDHAAVLADGVAAALPAPLLRVLAARNGPPQVALSSSRRARAARRLGLSRRGRGLDLAGCTVVLVDDVRTTGASVDAAARILARRGAGPVVAAVAAVTDLPSFSRAR